MYYTHNPYAPFLRYFLWCEICTVLVENESFKCKNTWATMASINYMRLDLYRFRVERVVVNNKSGQDDNNMTASKAVYVLKNLRMSYSFMEKETKSICIVLMCIQCIPSIIIQLKNVFILL